MNEIEQLKEWIADSGNIVFFGGAGVSTESGIPDFRAESGLYHAQQQYGYSPEQMLSRSFYEQNPKMFFKYYKENLIHLDAEPNDAHRTLARLEEEGKLKAVVTQNIDGLHQRAGSRVVYELHGSVLRNFCERCKKAYPVEAVLDSTDVPRCGCGGRIKPDVVLYEEGLDNDTVSGAIQAISRADMLIVGGTSLVVYPAAGLIQYYTGNRLVVINKTDVGVGADLVINGAIGEVLSQIQV